MSNQTVALVVLVFGLHAAPAGASGEPNWSEGVSISTPRSNPYEIEARDLSRARLNGQRFAIEYPVDVSGIRLPWRPVRDFIEKPKLTPLRGLMQMIFRNLLNVKTADDFFGEIGLQPFPKSAQPYPFDIPSPTNPLATRMGVTIQPHGGTEVFTLSCAACHSANLFGTKILGMTNRFPKANEFFVLGKKASAATSPLLFRASLGADAKETEVYKEMRVASRNVGAKTPEVLGLDTSLAQVALSLARRNSDADATINPTLQSRPRPEKLETFVADSKPAVWWNLKYKNRWLSDGSVVSGNPIYTNILWNEIGRGTDLRELSAWLDGNLDKIRELTTTVFGIEAPKYTDYFPAETISLVRAKRGSEIYEAKCERCHGVYAKNWELPNANALPLVEQLKTRAVVYPAKTPVVNVGTDPQRAEGMNSLEVGLNPLRISRENGVVIKTQKGYVPPPLVGIWARWPYFHNNSVPSLCAVLTPTKDRPVTYYAGEANDRARDFDDDCNGYPTGEHTPKEWRTSEYLYDTRRAGLSNQGHDEGIFVKDGVSTLSDEDRRDLIQFLKTL